MENKINLKNINAEDIVIDVMRHFGFRRNYQVAKYFDVTPQTLSGWIKSGEIPAKHLMKYSVEILGDKNVSDNTLKISPFNKNELNNQFSKKNIKEFFRRNYKSLILPPLITLFLTIIYLFLIADEIYTSESKVLPISEDGSSSRTFSGLASSFGINIPLNIGGKVPWDEIYPEILKSRNLLKSLLKKEYTTSKYGKMILKEIITNENNLQKYDESGIENRSIDKLRKMIKINKDRNSPIVKINVSTFEPLFASKLSEDLILESSLIQRKLKTSRIKQKRLFIEERLNQVSNQMKIMEKELRSFRENNRNLSTSPSLQMKVQEMGREVDLQNSLYVTLKTEFEKAKIDEVARDEMVQQIDGPNIPTKLTSPRRIETLTFAVFFGIFFSFIIIYLKKEYFSI